MADAFSKEIECLLCQETYLPVTATPEGKQGYKIYCTSCDEWLPIMNSNAVRLTLRHVLGLSGDALALAIESVLAPCAACGGDYAHDGGKRCPTCIRKIAREARGSGKQSGDFHCPWNLSELKKSEGKIFEYIYNRIESKEKSLGDLIQEFEAGQIDAETYMEAVESLPYRESRLIAAVQTWAMIVGPEMAFRAAEEHGLVERFGTPILISIAQGLEMATGQAMLPTLSREKDNWGGEVQKELRTFITKIGGGF